VKKKINPIVGILVVLVAIGIALGVMWFASEAPIADKPSVPFWLREGGTGGGPLGPPAGLAAPKTQAKLETSAKSNAKQTTLPAKGATAVRKLTTEKEPASQ
jgi:hypothetical protein